MALLDLGLLTPGKARALAAQLIARLASYGGVRVGLAQGRFVALVAARMAEAGSSLLVPYTKQSHFLAPLSLNHLPMDQEMLRRLNLLGIHTLGMLADFSENALADQFGAQGSRMAALARGIDQQPMNPIQMAEVLAMRVEFDSPIASGDELLGLVKTQLLDLTAKMHDKGQLTTRLQVVLFLEGSCISPKFVINFAAPHREAARLLAALRQRLVGMEFAQPISGISLSLEGLVAEYARQLTFAALAPKSQRWRGVERVLERLRSREEPFMLMQVIWDQPTAPVPERRAHLSDRVLSTRQRGLYLPKQLSVAVGPSGSPQLIRTRSRWMSVKCVKESWAVEDDWWTTQPLQRSYYRVILENGAALRLFRDGATGCWYHQTR